MTASAVVDTPNSQEGRQMIFVGNIKKRSCKKIKRNKNMCAIVLKNRDGYQRAKAIAGDDIKKLIEEYKKTGEAYIEGPNSEVHNQPGYIRFMDKGKLKKIVKKVSKKKK